MKLSHVSILHRHGSRGPGASELSLWEGENSSILKNWKEEEREKLNGFGHEMVVTLGEWFRATYAGLPGLSSTKSPLWRCSSSGRGRESGIDFVKGFCGGGADKAAIEQSERDLSPDHYFRPWKIYTAEAKLVKNRIQTESCWTKKALEEREFLLRIFGALDVKPKLLENLPSLLWSTTYVVAVRDCEMYDSLNSKDRACITSIITDPRDWAHLTELACWVWSERFLHSGFEVQMGGHIAVDIFEDMLGSNSESHSLSIFSGHDYTLLGLLGVSKAMETMKSSTGFASYLIFELWEPESPTDGGDARDENRKESFVRVKYNSVPFIDRASDSVVREVQIANEETLCEYSVTEVNKLLEFIRAEQEKLGIGKLDVDKAGRSIAECHSFLSSPKSESGKSFSISDLDAYIATECVPNDAVRDDTALQAHSEDNG